MSASDLMERIAAQQRRLINLETQEMIPIVARYTTNAAQSLNTGSDTIINFEDLGFDTWAAVTIGASWKFTAPIGGYYLVSAAIEFAATTNWADGERAMLQVFKGGVLSCVLAAQENHPATSHKVQLGGSALITMDASEYVDIRGNQASGGSLALVSTGVSNHVQIMRIR